MLLRISLGSRCLHHILKYKTFPIQPIEALAAFAIVFLIFNREKKKRFKPDGFSYPIMLMLFGYIRFLLEFARNNDKLFFGDAGHVCRSGGNGLARDGEKGAIAVKNLKTKKFIALLSLALLLCCALISVALAATEVKGKSGTWTLNGLALGYSYKGEAVIYPGQSGTLSTTSAAVNAKLEGSTLTVSATSSKYRDLWVTKQYAGVVTNTLTVTNKSAYPIKINDRTVSGDTGDAKINGLDPGSIIYPGASFTVTVTATPSGGKDEIAHTSTVNITIDAEAMKTVEITAAASPYVAYTLNGKTVSKGGSDVTFEADVGDNIPLPAITAPTGYEFIGWRIGSTLNKGSSFTVDSGCVIYPVIVTEGTADGKYFKVGNDTYTFWEDAVNAAVTDNKQIVLAADCTLPATVLDNAVLPSVGTYVQDDGNGHPVYLIPSGVTFIVPYADSYQYDKVSKHPYACEEQVTSTSGTATPVGDKVFRELTVPSGASVSVSGFMAVGGNTNGVCQISGDHANVHLEAGAAIHVKSGGRLSSCGYIYGDGTVTAENGGYVYMPFSVLDFRGGGYTVGVAGKLDSNYGIAFPFPSGENGISPFTRYHMGAIQTRLVIEHKAALIGYVDLYANKAHNNANVNIIGSSDGLIILKSGAVEITYDSGTYISSNATLGKTKIKIDGDAEFGHLKLTVDAGVAKATIDTARINFPIPYNFDIEIASGTFDVQNSVMLLPGASVIVDEGATLNVNKSLTVYDGLHDFTSSGSESSTQVALGGYEKGSGAKNESSYADIVTSSDTYPTTAALQGATFGGSGSADLIVNGTMNLNSGSSFGGVVQTGSSGAAKIVVASSGVGTSTKTQIGAVGSWSAVLISRNYGYAGATVRTLQGQIIDTGTGKRTNLAAGKTYQPAAGTENISSYTYTLYYDSAKKNIELTDDVACILQGSWYNYEVDVYMVLDGQKSGPVKMYFAHGAALPEGYYYDENKASRAASVTGNQALYFIGEAEAEIRWANGSGTTKYPSVRNAVKDIVNVGDTIVLLKDLTDFSSTIGPEAGQEFTFDMNGHRINYRSTPFASLGGIMTVNMSGGKITNVVGEKHSDSPVVLINDPQGSITLNLNGGEISVTGTASAPLTNGGVENGGNLTIDLGGGSWEYKTGLAVPTASNEAGTQHHNLTVMAVYQNKAMFNNAGTLTIKDTVGGGSVTTDLISNGTTLTATTPTTNYVSVIRNNAGATLVLDGGTFILDPSGDVNGDAVLSTAATPMPMALYSAVVLNFGDIKSSGEGSAVSLKGMGGYVLYNFKGGTVDLDLKGGTIELAEYKKGTAKNPAMYKDKVAVGNDGEMTLKSSAGKGNILMNVPTSSGSLYGILNSSNAAIFSTLTLNGVNIQLLNAPTNSSYGVYNRAGSNILGIKDTNITMVLGQAVNSAGSATTTTTIGDITNSTFTVSKRYASEDGTVAAVTGSNAFVVTYTDIGNIKDSVFSSVDTYALSATSGSTIKSITGGKFTSTVSGGLTLGCLASASTYSAKAAKIGDITGVEFDVQTIGINAAGAEASAYGKAIGPEIGNIVKCIFKTNTGNGMTIAGAKANANGAAAAPIIGNITDCNITAAACGISISGAAGNTAFPEHAIATVGDITGNTVNSGTNGAIYLTYAHAGVIEDCHLTSSKQGNTTGVIHVVNLSSVKQIKDTDVVSEETATTTNSTAAGIYTSGGVTIGDIIHCNITTTKGPAISHNATAALGVSTIGNIERCTIVSGVGGIVGAGGVATATANAAAPVIGDIVDTTFDTVTYGISIGSAAANTFGAGAGAVVGDITGCTVNAGSYGIQIAGGAGTLANIFEDVGFAKVGDITGTTVNSGTYSIYLNYCKGGVIEDCYLNATSPAANSYVLGNANGSYIEHIKNTPITVTAPAAKSYGIYNNGGEIGLIENSPIDAPYGIYNLNVRATAHTTETGSTISYYGHIGTIKDMEVKVAQWALQNRGVIDQIIGKCTFIAANPSAQVPWDHGTIANGNAAANTFVNYNTWWGSDGNSTIWKQTDTYDDDGRLTRTIEYMWDDDHRPTIGKISGDIQIIALNTSNNVAHGVAMINNGIINEISGNVAIETYIHPENTTITSSSYGIQNTSGGRIDKITGNVRISAGAYAIQNSTGQLYIINKVTYNGGTATSGQETEIYREYYHDYDGIGEITGDMNGQGIIIEATAGSYALENHARIGDITGKVTITADNGSYAIQNTTGTTINIIQTMSWPGADQDTPKTYHQEYLMASIGTIGGEGSEILISSKGAANNTYTLQNNGRIEAILEGVTIKDLAGYATMPTVFNSEGSYTELDYTYSHLSYNSDLGRYYTKVTRDYVYEQPYIGEIRGVTVTTQTNYALRNTGYIGSITNSSFTAATGYGIDNTLSYAVEDGEEYARETVQICYGTTPLAVTTSHLNETTIWFTRGQATIGEIDNVTITVESGNYGIQNAGIIDSITNSTIKVLSGNYAIGNSVRAATGEDVSMMENYIYQNDAGNYVATATASITDKVWSYAAPTIGSIGKGNTIEAVSQTIYNTGHIEEIGSAEGERTIIKATGDTATTQYAIYNYRGLVTHQERNNSTTTVDTNTGARIDLIHDVSVNSVKSVAIYNGDGTSNALHPSIGEIAEGTEVTSAGANAVYNHATNAEIEKITGGIFATGEGAFYAIYNNSTTYPIVLSGGNFKGGSNDRAHAIYDADNTARYTYPEGMFLSQGTRDVTFADGEPGTKYYFITVNGFYLIFECNGATEGEMEKQMVSLADPNAEVTLTKNGFTFTLDGVELDFLGWATTSGASEIELENQWSTTVQTLKNLLEAALGTEIQAGTEVKLYAVWNTEDASTYTITWGDLDFTYTRPTYCWDAENMQYVLETAGSWRATGEKEPIITVEVAGDAGYEVRLSYLSENGFGFGLTFTGRGDVEVTDNTFTIPGNGKAVVEAMLTGEPGDGSADKIKVGTVTIELTKQESQQTP